jgi:hypothetical protein
LHEPLHLYIAGVLARRLLALIGVLLVLLAVASQVAPRDTGPKTTSVRTPPPTTPSVAPAPRSDTEIRATLPGPPAHGTKVVRAAVGDLLTLTVRADIPDSVEIPALGEVEPVDPTTPAEFSLFLARPGRYDVRLQSDHTLLGRLRVTAAS